MSRFPTIARTIVFAALSLGAPGVRAQDLFEIQVYPHETVERRHTMVELHMNYIPEGTRDAEGGVFPNHRQFHFTVEVTHGLSQHWELAGYVVTAYVPGAGPQYAGARIRPRFSAPESWRLPFKFGVSTELAFNQRQFDPNTITLEIRPILEKEAGKWYFALNPSFSQSLRGPDSHTGPSFEPATKVAYNLTKKVAAGFEYYAETGPINHILPGSRQHHLIFPAVDFNVSPNWELNFAVGRGLTGASEHWIVKWIIGRRFRF